MNNTTLKHPFIFGVVVGIFTKPIITRLLSDGKPVIHITITPNDTTEQPTEN